MTPADYTTLAILGTFTVVAVLGGLKWIVRCVLGLAAGCVVLMALSHFADVPPPAEIGRFINDSRVVRAITGAMDDESDARTNDEAPR